MSDTQYETKTLEYAFVRQLSLAKAMDFSSSMSVRTQGGAHDAIFPSHEKLLLVEFRLRPLDVEIERGRYDDFDMVKALLGQSGGHHLVVHGQFADNLLALRCRTYFHDAATELATIGGKKGVDQQHFKKYLLQLLALRKRHPQRGGAIDIDEHASVLAVNSHDVIVAACSLRDYVGKLFPAFVTELPSAAQESGRTA